MRISDWSSDVCSSDLRDRSACLRAVKACVAVSSPAAAGRTNPALLPRSEERRVGKSVSVRVDLGGRRIIKKKKRKKTRKRRNEAVLTSHTQEYERRQSNK